MNNNPNSLKIVGIIPARFASTRFPGKPLVNLCGKPMLQWVIEGAKTSSALSEIYVATDHEEIAKLAEKCGVRAIMTTSTCLTGTDRVFEAIQTLKKENKNFDVVINIQGDEPLISKMFIDPLAQAFIEQHDLEMATLAHPIDQSDIENLNAVKVLIDHQSEAIYFSRLAIPFSREKFSVGHFDSCVQKHIGLYGFSIKFLEIFCKTPQSIIEKAESLEQLRAVHLGAKIKIVTVKAAIQGIDTIEDLKIFEEKHKYKGSYEKK